MVSERDSTKKTPGETSMAVTASPSVACEKVYKEATPYNRFGVPQMTKLMFEQQQPRHVPLLPNPAVVTSSPVQVENSIQTDENPMVDSTMQTETTEVSEIRQQLNNIEHGLQQVLAHIGQGMNSVAQTLSTNTEMNEEQERQFLGL